MPEDSKNRSAANAPTAHGYSPGGERPIQFEVSAFAILEDGSRIAEHDVVRGLSFSTPSSSQTGDAEGEMSRYLFEEMVQDWRERESDDLFGPLTEALRSEGVPASLDEISALPFRVELDRSAEEFLNG